MHSLDTFDDANDDKDIGVLMYEIVNDEPSIRRRSADPRAPTRVGPSESPWGKSDDRDVLPTKSHVNRRFDELQKSVCGAVGVLHGEVTALKLALTASEAFEGDQVGLNSMERVESLALSPTNLNRCQLRELFDLISEFEIIPSVDVSAVAIESLKSEDGPLRAASAGALGVIKPVGVTSALAAAFEVEANRHIKKIMGRSLKATIQ